MGKSPEGLTNSSPDKGSRDLKNNNREDQHAMRQVGLKGMEWVGIMSLCFATC